MLENSALDGCASVQPLSILFGAPYHSAVTPHYCLSALATQRRLIEAGIESETLFWSGSLITRQRNQIVAEFLKRKCTHLFWIDADIAFEPEGVLALLALNADIGVGGYSLKKQGGPLVICSEDGKNMPDLSGLDGPTEVALAGTGFMCVQRRVIETLANAASKYAEDDGSVVPWLFQTGMYGGVHMPEDFFFCRVAREYGFKVMLEPSVRLGHVGQYMYETSIAQR